jgi:hypothetical protein
VGVGVGSGVGVGAGTGISGAVVSATAVGWLSGASFV